MFLREGKDGRWGRENTILCMYVVFTVCVFSYPGYVYIYCSLVTRTNMMYDQEMRYEGRSRVAIGKRE